MNRVLWVLAVLSVASVGACSASFVTHGPFEPCPPDHEAVRGKCVPTDNYNMPLGHKADAGR